MLWRLYGGSIKLLKEAECRQWSRVSPSLRCLGRGSLIVASWGNVPDFELGELWLRPRFSAVDRGEVESVRLKVDVHVVREDAQVSPFFFF